MRTVRALALLTLLSAPLLGEEAAKDGLGRDYWVYLPRRVEPSKAYWLVVGVHPMGGTGQGACGFSGWAQRRNDCIVVGPSFPSDGYQFLQKDSGRQLVELIDALGKRHHLQPKAFVAGFSGGAQFAHRFANAYPEKVIGFAAHSAGSWSTGAPWGETNPSTRSIPCVITCGANDTGKMAAEAPWGRLEWAQTYARRLQEAGQPVLTAWIPRTGHTLTPEAMRLTEVAFDVAIGNPAASGADAERLRAAVKSAATRR